MANAPAFTITNESLTVVWKGKPVVVQKGAANYSALRAAILEEDWDAIEEHFTVSKSIRAWAKGKFTFDEDVFFYDGVRLPSELNQRIIAMATANDDPQALFKFWERLCKNPSFRSVQQLYQFLQHEGIPVTEDGCFLAYKGVKEDYTDVHSGLFNNKPGEINKMPRNQISDDPNHACHEGFHVGALTYAKDFGPCVVICKVDPEHVVCVPYDSSQHKMRVCEYEVIGNHNGSQLPSTTFKADKYDSIKKRPAKKGFAKLDKMDMNGLMKQSIEVLRRYAGKGLTITGASKIPGGKVALIVRILAVRA